MGAFTGSLSHAALIARMMIMTSCEPPDDAASDAFAAFYREYVPRLVGFLMLQGAQLDEATDVAQETMARAYRLWAEIKHPPAWVWTVARREWQDRRRNNREHPAGEISDGGLLLRSSTDVSVWEARHDLLRAVVSLPERQREVIAWTLAGYTPVEIANVLKIEPTAVRSSLWKARQTLSKILRPWEDG